MKSVFEYPNNIVPPDPTDAVLDDAPPSSDYNPSNDFVDEETPF